MDQGIVIKGVLAEDSKKKKGASHVLFRAQES